MYVGHGNALHGEDYLALRDDENSFAVPGMTRMGSSLLVTGAVMYLLSQFQSELD